MSDFTLAFINGVAEAFILFVNGFDGVVNVDIDDGVNGLLIVFIGIVLFLFFNGSKARCVMLINPSLSFRRPNICLSINI